MVITHEGQKRGGGLGDVGNNPLLNAVPRIRAGSEGIKEKDGGVNLIKIHCKHLCKCHVYILSLYNMLIIKKRKRNRLKNN
jgi:hypothetical protein